MKKLLLVITIVITSVCVNAQVFKSEYGQHGVYQSNKWVYGQIVDCTVRFVFDGRTFYSSDDAHSRYTVYEEGEIGYGDKLTSFTYRKVKDEKGRSCGIVITTFDNDGSQVISIIYKTALFRYYLKKEEETSEIQ
jgi:hypothetical protein